MAAKQPAQWFRAEIATGLQTLIVLRLQNAPAADTTRATAEVWVATLWRRPIDWRQDKDTRRIRTAFQRIAADCDRWPAPKTLLARLPSKIEDLYLPEPPISQQQRDRNRAKLAELLRMLAEKYPSKRKT